MEQSLSHIWLAASSYMGKYLRISSCIRKPFLIYDFATLNFRIYEEKLIFFFYQCSKRMLSKFSALTLLFSITSIQNLAWWGPERIEWSIENQAYFRSSDSPPFPPPRLWGKLIFVFRKKKLCLKNILTLTAEGMKTNFFNLSLLLLFMDPGSGIRDPESGIRDPGWVKIRIRDPG
jgi:hypothetical protein